MSIGLKAPSDKTSMRVILDSNILIFREDHEIIPPGLARLITTMKKHNIQLLIHPASIDDLNRDKNKKRKKVILSKVSTYPKLERPPNFKDDKQYLKIIGKKVVRTNDVVDHCLLFAIYRNAADFLITEDKGILNNAAKLNLAGRVLRIDDAIALLNQYEEPSLSSPPAVKEEHLYNLKLSDPIFDSLKKDYPEFEQWWEKISKAGRKAWVYFMPNHSVGAILMYKIEYEAIAATPALPKKRRLKIATLKVVHTGYKIGELYIKLAIEYAIKNGIEEIYLTLFPKNNDALIRLIEDSGFFKATRNGRGEDIYMKLLTVPQSQRRLSPTAISKKFYPSFYEGKDVKKFIVPIRPEYHDKLFLELKRQSTLFEYAGELVIEGNTIKKAYLHNSKIKKISEGDILLFYRSVDDHGVTSLGVVEEAHVNVSDLVSVIRIVGRRSVYSRDEISQMLRRPLGILIFRRHFYFETPIKLEYMLKRRLISGAPQSIIEVGHKQYSAIRKAGGIDGRFIVD